MSSPLVSVIIPNYNYANYIARTIDSVLSQTVKDVEIIVVDDGSKDDSIRILESYGDKLKFIRQQNQGVSSARNNGVAASGGRFVAFLDADDIWLPTKLEAQLVRFDQDSEVGLVHCSMDFIDPNDQPCGENHDGMEGWVAEEFLRFERGVVVGAGSTALVPRDVFDSIGGFDVRLSTAADWEFCYRLATRHKVAFVKEPLVLYRIHNSNMHGNIAAMEHDVLIGLEKAFSAGATVDRRKCYGNIHRALAGSYLYSGKYSEFFKHAAKSLVLRPSNLTYFAATPFRRLKRR